MSAKVSIVIPTYNRAADVVRAVNSALGQTLSPSEVIVVDDGSTDGTGEAIAAFGDRVRYVRKSNGGVSSARNFGFRQVTGDFIALLDSDDHWDPQWLARAVAAIESTPGAGAALCLETHCMTPDGRHHGIHDVKGRLVDGVIHLPSLLLGCAIGSNLVIRTEVQRIVGDFDTALVTGEDVDFSLRVAAVTSIAPVLEPSIYVTISTVSLSKNINTGNRLRVYDKFERSFPELARRHAGALRDARAHTAIGYARDLIWDRQLSAAGARLAESWSVRPSWEAMRLALKLSLLKVARRAGLEV